MQKEFKVYFLTNHTNKVLYIGVTSNLEKRLYEHRHEIISGFSQKYKCKKLVHFESFDDAESAIGREKQLKRWVRKKKDALVNSNNPEWKDLSEDWYSDLSTTPTKVGSAQDDDTVLSMNEWERYQRQLALPDLNAAHQIKLKQTKLLYVGAGGLGSAALPYLAAAGIGHITIADHDEISRSNLHRQTIYQDNEAGINKAEAAANYLRTLNPHCNVRAFPFKIRHCEEGDSLNFPSLHGSSVQSTCTQGMDHTHKACDDDTSYNLILDGSDNFETKTLLNALSIATKTPLISASVNRFEGQAGIFAGFATNAPCYHCLFPELPTDARNCNEAGILGTSAGLTGMYQAHITLCYLLGIGDIKEGTILSMDLKDIRITKLQLPKDQNCPHCRNATEEIAQEKEDKMAEMFSMDELKTKDHLIVDVRTEEEREADPIEGSLHMEISTLPSHYKELPTDTLLAFVCAGNVRSVKAADFMTAMGYDNVCILDKFSF